MQSEWFMLRARRRDRPRQGNEKMASVHKLGHIVDKIWLVLLA